MNKEIIIAIFVFIGCFLQFVGALGILRFPTFFTRLHASSKAGTLGVGFLMIAVAIQTPTLSVITKIVLANIFIFYTAATIAHLFAKAYLKLKPYPIKVIREAPILHKSDMNK